MSRALGRELPDDLFVLFNGEDLPEKLGKVILLTTVDVEGYPHPAMLSLAEIVAMDRSSLRLATYKDSTTSRNMRETGRLTLIITDADMNYYVKGRVTEFKNSLVSFPYMSAFHFEIEQILEDSDPQAPILSGIRFKAPDGEDLVEKGKKIFAEILL